MRRRESQSSLPWRAVQHFRLSFLLIALGLFFVLKFLTTHNIRREIMVTERGQTNASEALAFAKAPNPTIEIINGTEIIWEIPDDAKAVLFVAHGCGGSPLNFWFRCPSCPNCVGLPEESLIVLDALARKYAVLVVSSTDACWTYGKERLRVSAIIKWWLEKKDLLKVPLVGLGASSGGYFLSILATKVRFRCIVLMIASGLYDRMVNVPSSYPPTLFVHMPKDIQRSRKIDTHIGILRKAGIEVEEIKCMEIPLTPDWLAQRIPGLDPTTSSNLFEGLRDKGYIDANGYMKNDGRVMPWREIVKENNIALPLGSPLRNYVQEELNLAYGFHEMTSLQSNEIFRWVDSHT